MYCILDTVMVDMVQCCDARYQCLKCLNYDLCQNCFFVGLSTKGHKPKHPVQEYCYPSTR